MKKLYILMFVLVSGLFVACETPDSNEEASIKKEMGDGTGAIVVKPSPPIKPPTK
ncbi:hypothetical protein [Flavobacterium sp. NKUCC04_CG]|uniref:hypothetical protein n=1 Tax=Flavobacterium sp. NKUCC04_CG TaxID=2842121 RepID=UPI001C5B54EF|nr:hypothetical protein [Flavobacterium sp. NKUCC04_CG]MBW3518190.1 hypothetical protein [Flavobacterium sp. NKUCC04_CG]